MPARPARALFSFAPGPLIQIVNTISPVIPAQAGTHAEYTTPQYTFSRGLADAMATCMRDGPW